MVSRETTPSYDTVIIWPYHPYVILLSFFEIPPNKIFFKLYITLQEFIVKSAKMKFLVYILFSESFAGPPRHGSRSCAKDFAKMFGLRLKF